jgi:hypothetical protein
MSAPGNSMSRPPATLGVAARYARPKAAVVPPTTLMNRAASCCCLNRGQFAFNQHITATRVLGGPSFGECVLKMLTRQGGQLEGVDQLQPKISKIINVTGRHRRAMAAIMASICSFGDPAVPACNQVPVNHSGRLVERQNAATIKVLSIS